jgi:hypothetical protein
MYQVLREGVLMQLRKVTEEDLFSLIKLENEGFTPDEAAHFQV